MVKKIGDFDQLLETLEKRKKYIKKEFQAYGLMLAEKLGDWKNRSLYIRLAKQLPREILEEARFFVKDQPRGKVRSQARLFMWKLKELRNDNRKSRSPSSHRQK